MSPKANECKKSLDDQPAPLDSGKSDPASQPETMVSVSPAKKMVVKAHELKVDRKDLLADFSAYVAGLKSKIQSPVSEATAMMLAEEFYDQQSKKALSKHMNTGVHTEGSSSGIGTSGPASDVDQMLLGFNLEYMTLGDAADQGVDWRTLKKAPEELLKENPFEFLKEEFKKKKAAERKEH